MIPSRHSTGTSTEFHTCTKSDWRDTLTGA